MIKKFLLAASIISGVLMAGQAFAAAYYQPGQPAAKLMMTGTTTSAAIPNMTYHVMRAAGPFDGRIETGWIALMFVLTVAMLWVVLILLIAVLWHKLCEQRHHHREHHHHK